MSVKTKSTKKAKTSKKKESKTASDKRWSGEVTKHSNALDLEQDVFKYRDPKKIALSLKHSAEQSKRKKSGPYQSAMSMLSFYINRAGKNLTEKEKEPLERAKEELRKLFQRNQE